MSATSPAASKVVAAVAAGYLLGRTKKLRLAMTVAGLMAGRRLTGGGGSAGALLHSVTTSPELQRLQDQLRGRLTEAAKTAAVSVATSRVEALTESLRRQQSEDSGQEAEDSADEQEQPEQDDRGSAGQEDGPAPRKSAAKKAPTKKATAKKAPAKAAAAKSAATKSAATKSTAAKSAAKKAATKRSPVARG